ncbi:DUF2922 domain-containing protein [Companilactobacillus versmoldensis]|uniref:DUF2922 domain-containing protein n=1 Tax=Companilactobacillus versmoldensis DSM 14857 = KCTC 3814 TaxID=1423815 RepID=A0A0R1SCX4_9LACO|nr:DUF2922 domain-containing protein [Companilactobacillus versmoldensis]KRL67015.1 hypothetical protein FC27_GL002129 [Companilactobacillus versmoldensis DSM 14857 = KCTC 3814]
MTKLQMRFKTSEGKNRDLYFSYAKDHLDEITTNEAMKKIAKSQLFSKDNQPLFADTVSAQYIERVEHHIF